MKHVYTLKTGALTLADDAGLYQAARRGGAGDSRTAGNRGRAGVVGMNVFVSQPMKGKTETVSDTNRPPQRKPLIQCLTPTASATQAVDSVSDTNRLRNASR